MDRPQTHCGHVFFGEGVASGKRQDGGSGVAVGGLERREAHSLSLELWGKVLGVAELGWVLDGDGIRRIWVPLISNVRRSCSGLRDARQNALDAREAREFSWPTSRAEEQ